MIMHCKNLTMCFGRVFHVAALLLLIFRCIGTVRIRHNGGRQALLRFHGHGNGDGSAGLWPNVFNVATKASITANATCGSQRREEFCRLVEHGRGRCGICDANNPDSNKRHPIDNAIDGTNRWWQSPTLFTGSQYETVTITLDLKQIYQVVYVIIKAGNSPRPGTWILERSVDGDTYLPWQYYVINDDECPELHGVTATPGKPHYVTDTDVICTSYYSKLHPLENGEIHTSLVNGRPGANETSPELLAFTRARYVRLRLLKHRVSAGDLGPRWLTGWHQGSLAKKMYYSIRDIFIGGQCVCSGHANSCRHNVATGGPECECQHHTCGTHCEQCCPLYNQRPWGPGTSRDGHPCEPCQCHGHATECIYDEAVDAAGQSLDTYDRPRGGGVCLNCTDFTSGINCEQCLPGYFRPQDVSPEANIPCVPCDCDLDGSEGTCLQVPLEQAGRCVCRAGYAGVRCDHCAPGFRGYPHCEPCPCDARGTILREDCEGNCECKANVQGKRCDTCKAGHFALRTENLDGCSSCYCSGVASVCESSILSLQLVETLDDWLVCDITAKQTMKPVLDMDTHWLSIGNHEFPGIEAYYWLAPDMYTGNKLESYGSELVYTVNWVVMRGDTSGKPTTGPNIILVGANGLRIAHGDATFSVTNATIRAMLHEQNWYHVPLGVKDIVTRLRRTEYRGDPVSRSQFMGVLADVKHILLRAKFHTDQIEGNLQQAMLSVSANPDVVEKCACPTGYTGNSCESCDYGYVRILSNTTTHTEQGTCIKCNCNGHSAKCNNDNTGCECEHNTVGLICERCAVGFYGNPLAGTLDDCKRCACPLLNDGNNFSPSCQLDELDLDMKHDAYVCTQCPKGYTGDHCEICDYGYFGAPTTPSGNCTLCSCNGNPCDRATGQCLSCRGNTEGWRCDRCKTHHYGDPVSANCQPCTCDPIGSLAPDCDPFTGQCECKELFVGRTCDRCEAGYGNVTADCAACSCHLVGATSNICDPLSGICTCKPGVEGFRCDACQHLHYGFADTGCLGCACNSAGSELTSCDIKTGQCRCRPHVVGLNCNSCEDGYWGLETGNGCIECECDVIGSENSLCDQNTQQCLCKPGIGGLKCDTCLPGYFGFSNTGCQKCEYCDKPGHICDPDTGRCVCPMNSRGESCDRCIPNSYGLEFGKGCKSCNCAQYGCVKKQCDLFTGQCECKTGYTGQHCDKCSFGYYGYPRCRRCDCDRAGTEPERCDRNGHCSCDESGQCLCKAFVVGKQCNQCSNGTFGLHLDNPSGCTQCFCFGRTAHCTESNLTIGHIRLNTSRELEIEYNYRKKIIPSHKHLFNKHLTLENDLIVIPGVYDEKKSLDVETHVDRAIYWRLPNEFLDDRILSYGGYLRFMTETIGGTNTFTYNTYPLVQIKGNNRLVLEYYQLVPSKNYKHEIRLHESLWRRKDMPSALVSRDVLMVTLQKVQHILIRANDAVNFNKVVLHNVTLDTAITLPGSPPPLAKGVELCECPNQYNSSSCQNPSIGFFRYYNPSTVNGTIVIDLIGEARPCECNGRSNICDTETGHCLNCADNTTGANCQDCSEGYFGNPMHGKCKSCPCPSHERNFAKHCHHLQFGGFKCTCKPGYTGAKCDKCKLGYFGNPEQEGGSCKPCNCNKYGSASYECDGETGQCNCKQGIIGTDCSQCENHRYVLEANGCAPCNNCTQWLLNDLDKMVNDLDKLYAEYILYDRARQLHDKLNEMSNKSQILEKALEDYKFLQDSIKSYSLQPVNELYDTASKLKKSDIVDKSNKIQADIENINNDIHQLRKNIKEIFKQIEKTINDLNKFGKDHIKLKHAVREGSKLLEEIKRIPLIHPEFGDINNYCTNILYDIQRMKTNQSVLINKIEIDFQEFERRLNDMKYIVKNTLTDLDIGNQKNADINQRISQLKEKIQQLKSITFDSDDEDQNVKNAKGLLNMAKLNIEHLKDSDEFKSLITWIEDLIKEKKKFPLEELQKQVNDAKKHSEILRRLAEEYRRSFNISHETDIALKASKAYQDIVDYLNEARNIAENSESVINEANQKIYPEYQNSLATEAINVVKISDRLKFDAKTLLSNVDYLDEYRENLNISVSDTQNILWRTALTDNQLNINLRNIIPSKKDMYAIIHSANAVSNKMHEIYKNATHIKDQIKHNLRPELNKLQKAGIEIVSYGEEQLSVAERLMKNSLDILLSLETNNYVRRSNNTKLNDTISFKLEELKRRILKVKQAAYGIRIPLGNKPNSICIRSYKPSNFDPTTTTNIVVKISLDHFHKKSSLFYFPTAFNTFMALQLIDDHLQFLWKLDDAADMGRIDIRLPGPKTENSLYKIEVGRIANIVTMTVNYYGKDEEQISNSSLTSPDYTRFRSSPNDRIWVGAKLVSHNVITDTGLPGCLHDIVFNGKSVGLWNYLSSYGCYNCNASRFGQDYSNDCNFFNGNGYLVKKSDHYHNSKYTSINFNFRSYDEDALLFLAVDLPKNRFVSIILKNGRVQFHIEYAGNSVLILSTNKKYNTGNKTTISASRVFQKKTGEEGRLSVNEESQNGTPMKMPENNAFPNLEQATFYYGGVPPGFQIETNGTTRTLYTHTSFLGDIENMNVGGKVDLNVGKRYGVEPTCNSKLQNLRDAGFHGVGYIELAAQSLNASTAFSFLFQSLQNEAFILAAFDSEKIENYYAITIESAKLILTVQIGNKQITLSSNITVNDGRYHVVTIKTKKRKIDLRIDDNLYDQKDLDLRNKEISGNIYFGGLSNSTNNTEKIPEYLVDQNRLIGSIKDVIFNSMLLPFGRFVSFDGIKIGRSGPQPINDEMDTLTKLPIKPPPPVQCHRISSYSVETGSAKFGDSESSFIQQSFKNNFWDKDYIIELEFRTFYLNGLIFVSTGLKGKNRPYILLTLKNHVIYLTLKTNRKKIILEQKFDDFNEWHYITIRKLRKKLTLSVDGKSSEKKIPKKLNAGKIMFIGGVPVNDTSMSLSDINKEHQFRGCIRNFKVNNESQDLIKDHGSHGNVGQCFQRVEQGSYFAGDSYAIYKYNFVVHIQFEFEFEFRTWEQNGILLSITDSFTDYGLSLELYNGAVVMMENMGLNGPSKVETNLSTEYSLCDNKWHKVSALYSKEEMTVNVDGVVRSSLAINTPFMENRIESALYIGGLPGNATLGTLHIRENFKGCIRNVKIGGLIVDWTDMDNLKNMLLNSCPITD